MRSKAIHNMQVKEIREYIKDTNHKLRLLFFSVASLFELGMMSKSLAFTR